MRHHGSLAIQSTRAIDFLEALYRWDSSEDDWLGGICAPLLKLVPSGLWVQANTYDVSRHRYEALAAAWYRAPPVLREYFRKYSAQYTPTMITRCFRATSVATVRSRPNLERDTLAVLPDVERETGAGDILIINGLDPSGQSAALYVGLPKLRSVSAGALRLLRRLAGHVAAAARLRRRIAASTRRSADPTSGAEAIFSPQRGGRLLHAEAAAKGRRQRNYLTQAVRRREATRTRDASEQPLDAWLPRLDTRWTLVDTYESNGARYIVARENEAEVRTLEDLSERERQVVACLAFGQTTKEIAYSLGVDAITVRVLLQRAATKLAVTGRAGVLEHPAVKAMRGGIDAEELRRIRASEGSGR